MGGHDDQGLADPPAARSAHNVRRGKRGEARIPPAAAVLVAIALYAGRLLADLSGGLLRDENHKKLFDAVRALAAQSGSSQVLANADAEKTLRNRFRLVPAGQQSEGAFLLASERSTTN